MTATACGIAQNSVQPEASRMPEDHSRRIVLEMEEVERIP